MNTQKIMIVADLHGNMPATLAMQEEIGRIHPDEIWFLGDAVGKGPESDQTCDWVRSHCQYFVGGNWDYNISARGKNEQEARKSAFYCNQLGKERLEWLNQLPRERSLWMSGVHFRLFHGRPVTPLFQGSASDERLSSFFENDQGTFGGIICADSHRPFIRLTQSGYAINTGSVGNSLCKTMAHALLLEGVKDSREAATLQMTTLSVPYPREEAIARARLCEGMPNREAYINEILTGIYSR